MPLFAVRDLTRRSWPSARTSCHLPLPSLTAPAVMDASRKENASPIAGTNRAGSVPTPVPPSRARQRMCLNLSVRTGELQETLCSPFRLPMLAHHRLRVRGNIDGERDKCGTTAICSAGTKSVVGK